MVAVPRHAVGASTIVLHRHTVERRIQISLYGRVHCVKRRRHRFARKKARYQPRHRHRAIVHPHLFALPRHAIDQIGKDLGAHAGRKYFGIVGDAALRIIDQVPGRAAEETDLLRHIDPNTDTRSGVANAVRMRLRLIAVGRLREPYTIAACDDFQKRLAPYYSLDVVEMRPGKGTHAQLAMREEGERIAKVLIPGEPVWLLDRSGEQLTSEALSTRLQRLADSGTNRLNLIVAGTYGASDALRARADFRWSLSHLTFLHEWARMLVLEQLYRSAKIARNEPYHH